MPRYRKVYARFTNHDRWFLIQLYRWFPSILCVSKRQFADVDRARRCQDRNFEMICL